MKFGFILGEDSMYVLSGVMLTRTTTNNNTNNGNDKHSKEAGQGKC